MKQLAFKIAELEILLCAWGHGESWAFIVDSVLEQSLVNANIACIYWGNLWGQTCCSVIDGKLQLKHVPAVKKSNIKKIKKTW